MSDEGALAILIVDDDEGHIELLRRALRRAGVQNSIESVTDGASALNFVRRRGGHAGAGGELIVLLDINMPGELDGVEVLGRIKVDPSLEKTTVVMVSTADDPAEIEHCYQLGADAYMIKPVDAHTLIETMSSLGLAVRS